MIRSGAGSEQGVRTDGGRRQGAWIPIAAAVGLLLFLLRHYDLMPFSDPARWFSLARDLPGRFASTDLAYFYPAVLWVAIRTVGLYPAFLTNIPILALLAAALYGLCLRATDVPRSSAARASACALLALLIATHRELLLVMANPYRDPLAHLLAAAAMLLLVRPAASARRTAPLVGLLLALACSTRETYALLIPCFLLTIAFRHRFRPDSRTLWMEGCLFGAGLAVGLLPLLAQNYLNTGAFLVSGQGARALGLAAEGQPWLSLRYIPGHLGGLAGYLVRDFTWPVLGLAVLGLARAVRNRHTFLLALCLPAALAHALLYTAYHTLFERYLFTLVLFVYPMAAYGLEALLRKLPARALVAALPLALLGLLGALVWPSGTPASGRYRLEHVRALGRTLAENLEDGAVILGERPLPEMAACFFDYPALETRAIGGRVPVDRWRASLQTATEVVYVGSDARTRAYLRMGFDEEEIGTIDARAHQLQRLKRLTQPIGDTLSLYRVKPWTNTVFEHSLDAAPGDYHLLFNPGILSLEERREARLTADGAVLNDAVGDYLRFYRVTVPTGSKRFTLRLESDRPVPAAPAIHLQPVDEPIHLNLNRHTLPFFIDRFDRPWTEQRFFDHPGLVSSARLRLPTPDPERSYLVTLAFGWEETRHPAGRVTIQAAGHTLFDGLVDRRFRKARNLVSFGLPAAWIESGETMVEVAVAPAEGGSGTPRLALHALAVREIPPADGWRLEVGGREAEPFLANGFYWPDRLPDGRSIRWGSGRDQVLLPPLRSWPEALTMIYADPLRSFRPEASIRLLLNGRPWPGDEPSPVPGRDGQWSIRAAWPDWADPSLFQRLTIETEIVIPREVGAGEDGRALGVILESLTIEAGGGREPLAE